MLFLCACACACFVMILSKYFYNLTNIPIGTFPFFLKIMTETGQRLVLGTSRDNYTLSFDAVPKEMGAAAPVSKLINSGRDSVWYVRKFG